MFVQKGYFLDENYKILRYSRQGSCRYMEFFLDPNSMKNNLNTLFSEASSQFIHFWNHFNNVLPKIL